MKSIALALAVLAQAQGGWLGVEISDGKDLDQPIAVVRSVVPGGPAEKAGLLAGDLLITVDGHVVLGAEAVRRAVAHMPGATVHLGFMRGPERKLYDTTVTLGTAPVVRSPPPDQGLNGVAIYVAPHANAAEADRRYRNGDMTSDRQVMSRLLQEELLGRGAQIVTDPALALLRVTPTSQSHPVGRETYYEGKYELRVESATELIEVVKVPYQIDFDTMTRDDLARQNQRVVRMGADGLTQSQAVQRFLAERRR